ncbi:MULTISPECIES: phosphoenolpyruvate--protein phosphotransferase [unclassified Lysobacter]|uniref:phosphoenolpyruvate--protein phosphotransferase n=1 Tax=unclassified Lysobacter TaxID=2635362 RepID=UPI0006F80C2F|nr:MULTISPECIES: phosphoenolpyruvate--protein phosphotransferase [unclassified Lysobacter]KRA14616.1 phosphoenolpyruvate-protein phosphotransferase [Lysobacter sp. Root604]KRD34354.1 phosphoenolpyruvate-protein phosphotransferase [Lysobacter sp. Root916]KRD72778.1 phosphoenolpyruvate-protein phosphotransferase [Lysobacter sp. Root983]
MRQAFFGHGASRGSALGRARVRLPHALEVAEERISPAQVEAELARLHAAIETVRGEMHALRERLHGALAHEVGEFLDLHTLLLDDPELLHGLDELIRTGRYAADYALRLQRDRIASVFEAMDDAYFRSRVDDIDQVIGRIHAALHRRAGEMQGVAGEILITDNVAPAELAQLQTQGVLAIVTSAGSALSHSAILARSLHLPLVVGAAQALLKINDGDALTVDGSSGTVILEPNADDLRAHRSRVREHARERKQLHRLRREPTRTTDGVDIKLYANAESREDVAEAHALGAAGVGLYRTEFLFLQRNELPTEEEQFRAYRDVVLGMTGRSVTIRTLDLGADKADRTGLALRDEPNPALGLRGVRLSLARDGLLETQLRALLRASGYGPLRVLVPMVSSREEIRRVKRMLDQVAADLRHEGHEIAEHVPLGAMIEVPAAAIALPSFIGAIDFLSIGTNDLIQYLLAADRNNEALGELYTPLHPAVLRLIRDVIRLARARGKSVAVCGEMAGDPAFAPLLLALGLEEFSLHPATLLELRRAIRGMDLGALRARAPALLRARDRKAIEAWLRAN